jgi:hypothetical protein
MVGDGRPLGARDGAVGPPRLWTVAEANARLDGLRELLPRLRSWASRLSEVRVELARLSRFWGDELGARDQPDHGLHDRLSVEGRNLARRLDEAVGALRAEAIEVKALDTGLVDFYALVDDRLVFLCWRSDEPEVAYFHPLEGGFAGRRPLPDRLRSRAPDARGRA